jgi:hypothetical protein
LESEHQPQLTNKNKTMSKKKKDHTTEELPAMEGAGIAPLVIPELDRAVSKYEREKNKRCEASPGEIASKRELTKLLTAHAGELHVNEDGHRFYRTDGVDYIIEEKMKRRKADDGDESGSTED